MNYYSNLTADQVSSFYGLLKFLQRLRIIGHLDVMTRSFVDTSNKNYTLIKFSYSNDKTRISQEELLENIFGRLSKDLNQP